MIEKMLYISSAYISQIIRGIAMISIRNILSVEEVGIYAALNVYYYYLSYGHLGIRFAIDKELPIIFNQNSSSKEYENRSLSSILVLELVFSLSIILYVLFKKGDFPFVYIIIVGVSGVLYSFNEIFKVIYRSKQDVKAMKNYVLIYGISLAVTQLIGVILFRVKGLLTGVLIVNVLFSLYFIIKERFRFSIDLTFLKNKVLVGFPLFINGFIVFNILNIDKIFVMNFFEAKALGYYSTATMLFSMLIILPGTINEMIFPKQIIQVNEKQKIEDKVILDLIDITKLYYFISILFILLIPFFINLIMPKYIKSIGIIQILSINLLSFSITGLGSYLLITLEKKKQVILNSTLGIFVAILFNYIFITFYTKDIRLIAIASLITYFIYTFKYIIDLYRLTNNRKVFKVIIDYFKIILFLFIYFKSKEMLLLFSIVYIIEGFNYLKRVIIPRFL